MTEKTTMPSKARLEIKLIGYNTWANRKILAQVESLPQELFEKDLGGSFGSMKATMIHLLESDWLWVKRFQGIPLAPALPDWNNSTAALLKDNWTTVQDEMLKAVTDAPDKEIEFITRKGAHLKMPLQDIVLHLSHHGNYHRGQITNMIRQVGHSPVSTDYFIFYNS
ncbi:MAG TPA: DinB family protein [Cyclobacteriaceae bacterium]|nr:DinB family protein [Cyclobacteriaceae bacterium]